MALGSDDGGGDDDDDDDLEGSSGVSGEELFNRCINATLEAQEVCPVNGPRRVCIQTLRHRTMARRASKRSVLVRAPPIAYRALHFTELRPCRSKRFKCHPRPRAPAPSPTTSGF